MRGLHRVSLGEYREGLADIQAGNAATINSYPRPFPIEFMEDTLGTGQPAGGPGVCGAVQVILVGYPRPDFIELKDHFREAVIAAELGYGPDVYQTWHKFACRFSQSWPSDTILSLTALANTSMLRSSYLDNHRADLDADQLAAFNRLNGAMEALRVRARRFGEYDSLSASILLLGLDKKRGMPVAFYLQAESDYRRNRDMIQLFTELASFSYLELDCPAELEQYELLSDDLRSGRRLCRKKSYELNDEIDAAVAVINGNPPGQDDAESDASGE